MTEHRPERVLVFGDDMRIFLSVVRSLGRAGKQVHVVPFNWHAPALQSRYISEIHRVPRFSDCPTEWRDEVLALIRKYSFDLIIPCCDDRSLLAFDKYREDFADCPVVLPNRPIMELLFNKEETRALCRRLEIPVAEGRTLEQGDCGDTLAARFGLPLVLKPRRSYWVDDYDLPGKVWILDTAEEITQALATIEERSRYLAEAYFEGDGVGVSVLAHGGEILHAFQHRRLRQGRGGCSSNRVSEQVHPELAEACLKICRHVKLTGVCMFEFRFNAASGAWILIETNARFWGSLPLPLSLNQNFPLYLYDLYVHRVIDPPVRYAVGITGRNLVLDGYNLVGMIPSLKAGDVFPWLSGVIEFLTQPFRWITGSERSDSFVRDDLAPAFAECFSLLRSVREKLARNRAGGLVRRKNDQDQRGLPQASKERMAVAHVKGR